MCLATSVANASSELRRAYSRSRSMSSVGILPVHLRRREKVTDYFLRQTDKCIVISSPAPPLRDERAGERRLQFASAFVFICVHLRLSAVFFSASSRSRGAITRPLARRAAASYGYPGM